MSIIGKLLGLKKSVDLDAVIPKIEAEIADLQLKLKGLRERAMVAPFELGEDEVRALQVRIREVEDEISTLQGVAAEAERRRELAQQAELQADLEAQQEVTRAERSELAKSYAEADRLLTAFSAVLEDIGARSLKIEAANVHAKANGRDDLWVKSPRGGFLRTARVSIGELRAGVNEGTAAFKYIAENGK